MSEWISVKERLPKAYTDVVLLVGSKQIPKIGEFDSACHDWNIDEIGSVAITAVTHWMPLPKPPKEER